MARKKKFIAVTPISAIPAPLYKPLLTAFGGIEVTCQLCLEPCVLDAAVDVSEVEIFYCLNCSIGAAVNNLSINEVVAALVDGLSISWVRFITLMEVLKVEPGTRRYEALVNKLNDSGIIIAGLNSEEHDE